MKNIVKSLLIVVAVAAIAGGATWAYFSDNATITGNTFSAGTMDLRIDRNPDSQTQDWSNGFTVPYTYLQQLGLTNVAPGGTGNQVIDIKNVGTVNGGNVTIKLQRTSAWSDLSGKLKLTVYFDDENDGFVGEAPVVTGTLDEFNGNIYPIGALGSGQIASVNIVWEVPVSAGNEIQGDDVTFDTTFGLEQAH